MNDAPLFTALIVSRSRPRWQLLRRGVGVAAACLLHVAGLALLALAPLFFLELVNPPKAVVGPIIIENPHPLMSGPGGRPQSTSTGQRGRSARGTPVQGPRGSSPAKPIRPATQPVRIPLAPPATDEAARNLVSQQSLSADIRPTSGLEGGPEGPGGGPPGSPDGCDGCRGDGSGDRAGEGSGGPNGILGPGDPRVTQPILIESTRALPKYPEAARHARVGGEVILLIVIGPDGAVGQIEVLRSPDQRFGFDLSAIEAVKRWRYRPALLGGRPVSVYAQVIVEFTLSR